MQKMKNVVAIGTVSTAIAIASLTGCSTTMSTSSTKPHDGRSQGRVVDDENITKTVEKNLSTEPVFKFDNVTVKTFNGVVALSGFVNSADQSRRAEEIARNVGGVTQVANGLVVTPGPTPTATGKPSGQSSSQSGSGSSTTTAPPPGERQQQQ